MDMWPWSISRNVPCAPSKRIFFAPLHGAVEIDDCVANEWAQFFACRQIAFIASSKTDRLRAKRLENSVVLLDHLGVQFFREHNRLHQIGHAQAGARCLIAISRSNPAFGCSNSDMASTQFALLVEQR